MLIDRFFYYICLNLRPIGFYVDNREIRNPHAVYDSITAAMGFINFNDYIASIPGYSVYTEIYYWEDNSHRSFLVEPTTKCIVKTRQWVRLGYADEYPYNRRHTYWLLDIRSDVYFPFILPSVDEMISLKRFNNLKRNDPVFFCCRDWSEDDE